MSGFLGSHLHQIDDKGRLSLPAAFRRDGADAPLVLLQVHPDALTLYPIAAWAEVESRLRELLRLQPGSRPFVLRVTSSAVEVVPDRQGRIPLPARLRDAAALQGPALVVGALDRIEIWDPDRFQAMLATETPDFNRFTHQIFG
jgi:MraZ protein